MEELSEIISTIHSNHPPSSAIGQSLDQMFSCDLTNAFHPLNNRSIYEYTVVQHRLDSPDDLKS